MWVRIGFLLAGLLVGIAGTLFFHGQSRGTSALDDVAINAMAESAIDAIDLLQAGESEGAQLVLAGAVNAQTQIVFKMSDSSAEDLARARNWQSAMREHNERLGLQSAKEMAR